jgi:signal transduction histidine kinase
LFAPLARGSLGLGVLTLAVRALRSPEVDSRVRPLRLLAEAASAGIVLYAVLTVVSQLLGPGAQTPLYLVVGAVVAAGWLAAGTAFSRRDRYGQMGVWTGCTMLLIGVASLLRLITIVHPEPWIFTAGTVSLMAAGVAAAGAGTSLLSVLRQQDSRLLRLAVDLRASEGRYAGERARQEERLHDVRSALAAIRCANGTLSRYAARLDERTKATLEDALTKELGRLEGLVDPSIENPSVGFRLADVLKPLVATECSLGSEILLHVSDLAAYGRPADTAAVVQNLVVNARRYAPGSVITINASYRAGRIRIEVEDSGPGIDERERAAVFERGVRGSTSVGVEGTGLGLFVSSRLMTEQDGSLTLREGAAGGACFVLDLAAADFAAAEALPDAHTSSQPAAVAKH